MVYGPVHHALRVVAPVGRTECGDRRVVQPIPQSACVLEYAEGVGAMAPFEALRLM